MNVRLKDVGTDNLSVYYDLFTCPTVRGNYQGASTLTANDFLEKVSSSDRKYFIVELDGDPIGYAYLIPSTIFSALELGIGLKASARSRGFGTLVHKALLKEANFSDRENVVAITSKRNHAEIKCLRKSGFVPSARIPRIAKSLAGVEDLVIFLSSKRRYWKHALLFWGPAGVGKTTIAYALHDALSDNGTKIDYVSGDMLAHTFMNCDFCTEALDRKYDLVESMVSFLSNSPNSVLIIDDLFRRKEDFDRVALLLDGFSESVTSIFVNCPLLEAIKRDDLRFHKEKLGEKRIRQHHSFTNKLRTQYEALEIDSLAAIETNANYLKEVIFGCTDTQIP